MMIGKTGRLFAAAVLLAVLGAPALQASAREREPVMMKAGSAVPEWSEPAGNQAEAEGRLPDRDRAEAAEDQTIDGAAGTRDDASRKPAAHPHPGGRPAPHVPKTELTEKQRKELARLHKTLYETKKKLIGKYAEFGIITREQASLWLNRLEANYEKLKKHGYVPVWKKCGRPGMPKAAG